MRINPAAPASRARETRASIASRDPAQYSWANVFGHSGTISSIAVEASALSPIAVPRAAAARATARSASGCTAWTPAGESSTGRSTDTPITEVACARTADPPATCGANPSSANASRLSR